MGSMTDKIKVTIVIPVHNSEKYLKECIRSAQNQTLEAVEILCIDGGSTDSSPYIIKELQKNDKRIVYVTDQRTGYGHKLNVGIDRARGEYIAILESDDKMRMDMLQILYDKAIGCNADIVDADYDAFFSCNDRDYRNTVHKYTDEVIYDRLINAASDDGIDREIPACGIWTGIYKKEFLVKEYIRLNESDGASFQDTSFLFMTGLLAKSVYHIRKPLYQYRIDNAGSSVKDNTKIYEIVGECEFLRNELIKRKIQDNKIWKLYFVRKYNAFYWNYCRMSQEGRDLFLVRYAEELKSDAQKKLIDREMFGENLYERTFLVIDDRKRFSSTVCSNERKTWAEIFCNLLDKIEGRDIVIFGSGIRGNRVINLLQYNDITVQGICDNDKSLYDTQIYGIGVMSVENMVKKMPDAVYIIANSRHADEMERQLIAEGIKKTNIIVYQ